MPMLVVKEVFMARVIWKEQAVFSLKLKDGSLVFGQMLKSPYIVFFNKFLDKLEECTDLILEELDILFFCAVSTQFLKHSSINKLKNVSAREFDDYPQYWLQRFPSAREVTIWDNSDDELTFMIIGSPPGGQLIEKDIYATGIQNPTIVNDCIELTDEKTIESYELTGIWPFPQLNERLYLCKKAGRNIDPGKDLLFNRQLPKEYLVYMKMMAFKGTLKDWGYEE